MSRWRPEVLALGIDTGAVAALWHGRLTVRNATLDPRSIAPDGEIGHPLEIALRELLAVIRAGGAPVQPDRIRALVGADLCRHWTLVAPDGVASLRELRTVAAARCGQLFGGRGDDWAIVADWHLLRPFVCAAIPAAAVRALQAAAASAGVALQIESAVLAAVARLEPWLPAEGWCAWPSPTSLVLLLRRRGRFAWLQTLRHQQDGVNETLIDEASRHITRHCLRKGEPLPQALTWLGVADGNPSGSRETIDGERHALKVTTVHGLPDWQQYRPGTREAQWAVAPAVAGDARMAA